MRARSALSFSFRILLILFLLIPGCFLFLFAGLWQPTGTTGEWLAFADEHNTTIAPVNNAESIIDDPQFADRIDVLPTDDLGCEQLAFPLRIVGEELPVPGRAPDLGQHTDEVLATLDTP